MSTPTVTPAEPVSSTPGLSEMQRITSIFYAPSRTFADIKRSARWIGPVIVRMIIGLIFVTAVAQKIGWEQIQINQVSIGPESQKEQFEKATPEQRAVGL